MESLQALADPVRLAIVESLAAEPASVGVLAERFPISRPAVSRHLRLLKQAGLVDSVSDGTRRVYQVRPEGVSALREYMDGLWREAAARYTLVSENLPGIVVDDSPASKRPRPTKKRRS
ncbi:MAG: metalloregulator ArsR/SmtB family transcription factor [Actinomycetes bacterium]